MYRREENQNLNQAKYSQFLRILIYDIVTLHNPIFIYICMYFVNRPPLITASEAFHYIITNYSSSL